MANSQFIYMLVIAALLSAAMIAPTVDAECYEIHMEILCEGGNTNNCSAFCKQKFGPRTTVQCIENTGVPGPFCVCNACPPHHPGLEKIE